MDEQTQDKKTPQPQVPGIGRERDLGLVESGADRVVEVPQVLQEAGIESVVEQQAPSVTVNRAPQSNPVQQVMHEAPQDLESASIPQLEEEVKKGDAKTGVVGKAMIIIRQYPRIFNRKVF